MSDQFNNPHDRDEHGHDAFDYDAAAHDGLVEPPSKYEFSDDLGDDAHDHDPHAQNADIHDPAVSDADVIDPDPEDPAMTAAETGDTPPGRSILPLAAAAAGLVILGGIGWWHFGSGTSAPSSRPVAIATASPPAIHAAATTVTPRVSAAPSPETPLAANPPLTASAQPAAPAAPPGGAEPAAVATVPAPSATGQQALVPVPAVPQLASAAAVSAEQQKLTALAARLDALQQAVEQASAQLGQVSNMVAATVGNSNAAAETSKQLEQRLAALEQQIAQRQNHASRAAPHVALRKNLPNTEIVADDASDAAPPAPPLSSPHHRVHKAKSATSAASAAVGKPDSNWVLRAASPGQAFVSAGATSTDLKPLHVGDSLPGIGRVVAISDTGGQWSVKGTKGTLR